MTAERPGHYGHLDDNELADKIKDLQRRAKLNRRRNWHEAAASWEANAQLAQDELDSRKDNDDGDN